MSLRDCLELYNTDKKDVNEILNKIYKNVSTDYFANSNNKYMINKIVDAFNNVGMILGRFEYENERVLGEIKKHVLGCKIPDERMAEIERIMKEWAIYFPGIGVLPDIENLLIDRYRHEYIVGCLKQEKAKVYQTTYLEYLLFVRNIWDADKEKQIKILEEFNKCNNKMSDWMIEYLLMSNTENRFKKDERIIISDKYIDNLKSEKLLLKIINDIHQETFKTKLYFNYKEDLNKIYIVQKNIENWVDINKLNGLISDEKLNLLKSDYLIDEVDSDNQKIIKLTEIGFSIADGYILEKWTSDKYFLELEGRVLIPHNSNPLLISKYIFDKNYIIKEIDFLISLERKNDNIISEAKD